MNEKFLQQCFAEIVASNGAALGMLAAAIAQQLNPELLHRDLKAQIEASKHFDKIPEMARRLATDALAAVEAEWRLAKTQKH